MATVITHAVTSLDGFIADDDDEVGPLFDWYFNGDVELRGGQGDWKFNVSQTSFDYVDPFWRSCGSMVIGRRLFDITNGWNGVPSVGDRVFVVTHEPPADWVPSEDLSAEDAPFTFVTTGVEDAVNQAREVAGDRAVAVSPCGWNRPIVSPTTREDFTWPRSGRRPMSCIAYRIRRWTGFSPSRASGSARE